MASSTTASEEAVTLVDTGVLHIEQLRGPDVLPDSDCKLRAYLKDSEDVGQRSLQPVTGDQVVFRVKEAPNSTSDVAAARDVSKTSQQKMRQLGTPSSPSAAVGPTVSSSSSTPKASGPQVAVLGSPQVPVGLSSALGYLHLGQVARVKVPPHLLGQAVTDDMGTIQSVDDNLSSPVSSPQQQQRAQQPGSPASPAASSKPSTAQTTAGTGAGTVIQAGTSANSTSPQQLQQELSSHPIDVVEAAKHGAVPVHVSSSSNASTAGSPSARHHRSPGRQMHRRQGDIMKGRPATPTPDATTSDVATTRDTQRRFSDPVIIRPKGWHEKQQQQQQQAAVNGARPAAAISSLSPTTGASTEGPQRSSRVAAAAAHAAAAATDRDPIRRAVAAAMGKTHHPPAAPTGVHAASPSAAATAATGSDSGAGTGSSVVPGRHASPNRGVTAGGALAAPIVTGVDTPGVASDVPQAISTGSTPRLTAVPRGPERNTTGGQAAARPSPSPAVLPVSPVSSAPGLRAASPVAAGSTMAASSSNNTVGYSNRSSLNISTAAQTTASSGSMAGGRAVSPAAFRRSPSPITGRNLGGFTRADRGTTPDRSQGAAGPSGIAFFTRISPQASVEGPVPATPHPSPANYSSGIPVADQPGIVQGRASKLNHHVHHQQQQQQEEERKGQNAAINNSSWSQPESPFEQSRTAAAGREAAKAAGTSPPAAVEAAEVKMEWTDSIDSGSDAGFVTPPAAGGTPFFTPGSNTPQGPSGSDAGSTMSSNSNSGSIQAFGAAAGKVPPPRSLMTLGSSAAGGVSSASRRSSSSSAGGAVRSPRSSGWQQQQQGSTARAAGGGGLGAVTVAEGGPTARQLDFGSSSTAAGRALGVGVSQGRGHTVGGTALLQAAAEKLRQEYDDGATTNAVTAQAPAAAGTGMGTSAAWSGATRHVSQQRGVSPVKPLHSQGDKSPGSRQVGLTYLERHGAGLEAPHNAEGVSASTASTGQFTAAAGFKPGAAVAGLPESKSSGEQGPVSFAKWLPSEGAARGKNIMAAAAALAQDKARKGTGTGVGSSALAASSRGSAEEGSAAVGYMTAAGPQAGFGGPGLGGHYNRVSTSSGRTVTMDESSSEAHMQLDGQQYSPARHSVEGFSPGVSTGSGQVLGSSSAASASGKGRAGAMGDEASLDIQLPLPGGPLPSTSSGPVSPSKAVAAAALAEFAAASAAQPAAAAASSGNAHGHGHASAMPSARVTQSQVVVKPSTTPLPTSTVVYSHPFEHALMPTAAPAVAKPHQNEPETESSRSDGSRMKPAVGHSRSSSTTAPEAGTGAGSASQVGAQGRAAVGPAASGQGASSNVPGDRGDRVEYEVEVLAVIPGHGPLSGQPVLSEVAQQEHLNASDIRAAAAAVTSDAPHLKPPKPRKGFSGWLRRHLSLNTSAPWRAGKSGMGMIGLRDCFKGSGKGKNKGLEGQGDQPERKPQGEQQYQSWME